jgi:hypothetical protein
MSGTSRKPEPHLQLIENSETTAGEERVLRLARSPRLDRFAATAAAAGLEVAEAVRLALAQALALEDARVFGLDADTARRLLNRAAAGARAARPLGEGEAAYLRRLTSRTPKPVLALPPNLEVELDERTSTRVRGALTEAAIRPAVVEEMIAWEIAATLDGRTLGEWALHRLAASSRAA